MTHLLRSLEKLLTREEQRRWRSLVPLLFVSGDLALKLEDLGQRVQEALGPVPALIAAGHGVLTERGEVEGETAAAGIIWTGGETLPVAAPDSGGPDLGVTLAAALEPRLGPAATAFAFVRPRGVLPHTLDPLKSLRCAALVGAGTSVDDGVVVLIPGEQPRPAQAGALVLRGITPPTVRASPACRLLTPLTPITATRGPGPVSGSGSYLLGARVVLTSAEPITWADIDSLEVTGLSGWTITPRTRCAWAGGLAPQLATSVTSWSYGLRPAALASRRAWRATRRQWP